MKSENAGGSQSTEPTPAPRRLICANCNEPLSCVMCGDDAFDADWRLVATNLAEALRQLVESVDECIEPTGYTASIMKDDMAKARAALSEYQEAT